MPKHSDFMVRRLVPADAVSLFEAVRASHAELNYWLPWCKPDYALEDARSWIAFSQNGWSAGTEFPLGVFDASSGQVIGGTGINRIQRPDRVGNIGYWVSTPYAGRGVARFAALQAATIGFGDLRLTRLEIIVLTHNAASHRVAAALGAVRECQARNRVYFQGKPHDAVIYSLVPDDIPSLRADSPAG
jgi:RimJ/RimL family protein N-acetyltransferase